MNVIRLADLIAKGQVKGKRVAVPVAVLASA